MKWLCRCCDTDNYYGQILCKYTHFVVDFVVCFYLPANKTVTVMSPCGMNKVLLFCSEDRNCDTEGEKKVKQNVIYYDTTELQNTI